MRLLQLHVLQHTAQFSARSRSRFQFDRGDDAWWLLVLNRARRLQNEYRISIEGNPYPHDLVLINPAGDNLNIKRHGFTGPLGQLLSLKYTVYDDANEKLFTVVDGGFSNMPRVALIIEHKEVAVFDYGLNRLEMKCITNIPNYTIKGNFLFGDYDIFSQREVKLSSVIVLQCDKRSCFSIQVLDKAELAAAIGIPTAIALLRARIEEHLE